MSAAARLMPGLDLAPARQPLQFPPASDDFATIRAAQAGDPAAFAALYDQHLGFVTERCFQILRDRDRACDAAQDVFVHLHHTIGGFHFDSAFRTWLYRVATNLVLMQMRKKRPTDHAISLERLEPNVRHARHWSGPHRDAHSPQTIFSELQAHDHDPANSVALERALAQIAPSDRTLFLLVYGEGHAIADAAAATGYTVTVAKSRLYRTKIRLREMLSQ